jgi:hypothetical protein
MYTVVYIYIYIILIPEYSIINIYVYMYVILTIKLLNTPVTQFYWYSTVTCDYYGVVLFCIALTNLIAFVNQLTFPNSHFVQILFNFNYVCVWGKKSAFVVFVCVLVWVQLDMAIPKLGKDIMFQKEKCDVAIWRPHKHVTFLIKIWGRAGLINTENL